MNIIHEHEFFLPGIVRISELLFYYHILPPKSIILIVFFIFYMLEIYFYAFLLFGNADGSKQFNALIIYKFLLIFTKRNYLLKI